ncbi:MAG: VWA domain-containing protein [Rhizobiaceae bacterium]
MKKLQTLSTVAILAASLLNLNIAIAGEKAIIVLDASGSMWGQIDGVPKIKIARDALSKVVKNTPEATELGLMAYGHRKKGVCSDIELLVKPELGTRSNILNAIRGINPKGKTPLSASVLKAAESLKYTEEKATVILITDGLETCNADPCALGRELEQSGVDFTAHVVGFDLTKEEAAKVSCLATETGGKYIDAANADQLGEALTETVAVAPPPPPPPVKEKVEEAVKEMIIEGPAQTSASSKFTVAWDGMGNKSDLIGIRTVGKAWRRITSAYIVHDDPDNRTVTLVAPAKPGKYELYFYEYKTKKVIASQPIEITPIEISLDAPTEAKASHQIEVTWSAPGNKSDSVGIRRPGKKGKIITSEYINHEDTDERTVTVMTPAIPGKYELYYKDYKNSKIIFAQALEVIATEVSLDAPAQAKASHPIEVTWNAPGNKSDTVGIKQVGKKGKLIRSVYINHEEGDERTVSFVAPAKPGKYELYYKDYKNKKILHSQPIEITSIKVGLEAPAQSAASTPLEITWNGPANQSDTVGIKQVGKKGKLIRSVYINHEEEDERTVSFVTPAKPGKYELYYKDYKNKKILYTQPIEITPIKIGLEAPAQSGASTPLEITWDGPANQSDTVGIKQVGKKGKLIRSVYINHEEEDERTVSFVAPAKPGKYELYYKDYKNKKILYSQPIEITPISVSLEAPAQVAASTPLEVTWNGPANQSDTVGIKQVGKKGKIISSKYINHEDPDERTVTLMSPKKSGTYELFYKDYKNGAILVTKTIEVTN